MANDRMGAGSDAEMRRGTLLALTVLMTLNGAAPAVAARDQGRAAGATIERARLLDGPKRGSHTLLRLDAETDITIAGRAQNGFYPVRVAGVDGWLATGAVAVSLDAPAHHRKPSKSAHSAANDGAAKAGKAKAAGGKAGRHGGGGGHRRGHVRTKSAVNLRAAASGDASVLQVVPRGTQVEPSGEQRDGYVHVDANGASGWLRGNYLTVGRAAPVAAPANGTTYRRRELIQIINEAADQYGQSREAMLRVARCESNLTPTAVNKKGGSYGLFQFKTQTWLGTPYAAYDIFDPRANALAAGWMWSVGRKGAWVCQ
ncbi:MAG TPA: SH3 domain-containing protein [Thermomicrobiales bacterium]|nr:SH3 domain-containing protein [Thermomicrobiales bacterium]